MLKEIKNNIYYMGCKKSLDYRELDNITFDYKVIIEQKYDGIWCAPVWDSKGRVTLYSRTGKVKDNKQLLSLIKALQKCKFKNTIMCGELAFGSATATAWAEKHGHHKIDIFDVICFNGKDIRGVTTIDRKKFLDKKLKRYANSYIVLAPWVLSEKGKYIRKC